MDNDYNKYLLGKGLTNKTTMKREQFDKVYWISLSPEMQLDKMVKFATEFLCISDSWADEQMRIRRKNRKLNRPKSMSVNKLRILKNMENKYGL